MCVYVYVIMGKVKCEDCEFLQKLKKREASRPPKRVLPKKKRPPVDLVCKQCGVERDSGHYAVLHNIFPFEYISSE